MLELQIPSTLLYLTYITIILLIGLLCSAISRRVRVPNVLLLLFAGIFLSKITYGGSSIVEFSPLFLTTIGTIALIMIIFDSTARLRFKDFDTLSLQVLKLTIIFILLGLLILTPAALFVIGFPLKLHYVLIAAIFASTMIGTDAGSVLSMLRAGKGRVPDFLEIESILNTPFMVILPFMIIGIINRGGSGIELLTFTGQLVPFLTQITVGIGAGVLIGLIVFKVMRKYYSNELSPIAVIAAALLTYILAENLRGSGVLAVTALGLIFGSIYIKQKPHLMDFSLIFSTALEVFVFVLIGFIISFPLTAEFFIRSFFLFIIFIFVRALSLQVSFPGKTYSTKEKFFMSLCVPKGITVAVLVFFLASYTYSLNGLDKVLSYMLAFLLYSIIVASFAVRYSASLLKTEAAKETDVKENSGRAR